MVCDLVEREGGADDYGGAGAAAQSWAPKISSPLYWM